MAIRPRVSEQTGLTDGLSGLCFSYMSMWSCDSEALASQKKSTLSKSGIVPGHRPRDHISLQATSCSGFPFEPSLQTCHRLLPVFRCSFVHVSNGSAANGHLRLCTIHSFNQARALIPPTTLPALFVYTAAMCSIQKQNRMLFHAF